MFSYSSCVCFLQAEDGIRYLVRSRGLGDVYKRQVLNDAPLTNPTVISAGDVLAIGSVQLKLELPGRREGENESGIRDSNP